MEKESQKVVFIILIFMLGLFIGMTFMGIYITKTVTDSAKEQITKRVIEAWNGSKFWAGATYACVEGSPKEEMLKHALFKPNANFDESYLAGYEAFKYNQSILFTYPKTMFRYDWDAAPNYPFGGKRNNSNQK